MSLLRKPFGHIRHNVVAYLALFFALGTGGAYAANTIRTGDIVDNEVFTTDVRDDTLGFGGLQHQDLGPGSVRSSEVQDDSLTNADIQNFTLGNGDFLTGSVDGRVITDNSVASADVQLSSLQGIDVAGNTLTGADINESSLSMPPTTTATFAGIPSSVPLNATFTKVTGKTLPAGSYAITATADYRASTVSEIVRDTVCQLRNGGGFIGGATDRRTFHSSDYATASLSMNGGAQVPAGGGEVSLWCLSQAGGGVVNSAQMMIIRLDGFF